MTLTNEEIVELQQKYRDLINYDSDDRLAPIDPLTYVDSNGDALLHIATARSDRRAMELLLKGGIDVNLTGDMGNTPLHYARTKEIADVLLAHGAFRDAVNEFGQHPKIR